MNNQLTFVDIPKVKSANTKRNWENRFQRWSNRLLHEETSPLGKCGYGMICEYCDGAFEYKSPCIRALHNAQKELNLEIDYLKDNFEDIFMLRKADYQQ